MATNNPPPYFPQGSLTPTDPNRYRKFKMIVAAVVFFIVLAIVGAGVGVYYLVRSVY